jgi:N-methylhydantoinase A
LPYYIGIDIGGTFTDMVLLDVEGVFRTYKTPSTPKDLSLGVLDCLELAAEDLGLGVRELLSNTAYLGHGTTAATNAFIEGRGVKTGLITTKGFGDTILIQRAIGQWIHLGERVSRYSMRSLPKPLIPSDLIREVGERVDYKGEVVVPLNRDEARRVVTELMHQGVQAIAICLLWSFKNPQHEQEIKGIIAKERPDLFVTASSDLIPVIREYERMSTTALNSVLGPVMATYLSNLETSLRTLGFQGSLRIMDSSGGVVPVGAAPRLAASLLTSGPAGGVLASLQLAETLGEKNAITTDMGGTSFDVSLIVDGKPLIASTSVVGQYHVALPMVNITAIGAGGGSIASVVDGHVTVGPRSAGADPGPACYDKGGLDPTVTDADVVLGVIDPDYFLGGRIKLNHDRAWRAVEEKVARPMNMDVIEAAAGIRTIVDNRMGDLLRTLTIERGYDPREFILFAYGGAGPAHCSTYGFEANVRAIVVPFTATVHSAYGGVASDLHRSLALSDLIQTPPFFDTASKYLDPQRITANFLKLEEECRRLMDRPLGEASIEFRRHLDMRYRRQVNELVVPVPIGKLEASDIDDLVDRFERKYEELYGQGAAFREAGVEITTFRVEGVIKHKRPQPKRYPLAKNDPSVALIGERRVYFGELKKYVSARIYAGVRVEAGFRIEGPALIEHPGTTILIGPAQVARLDELLNTFIERMPS